MKLNGGRRWVELLDSEDTLMVLDGEAERACKVSYGKDGMLVFEFRDGVKVIGDRVEVPPLVKARDESDA